MILDPPFTVAQFFTVFANYNAAIWPLQIAAYGLGFLAVIALWLRGPLATRVILSALALMWASDWQKHDHHGNHAAHAC